MKGRKQTRLSHKFAVLQHSHKKRKNSLETRAVLLVLWLELEFLRWPYRKDIEAAKRLLAVKIFFFFIFRSYCYSAKASEVVVKISTDEKDKDSYKCSLCVIVWIATAYQEYCRLSISYNYFCSFFYSYFLVLFIIWNSCVISSDFIIICHNNYES